jgi:hypothetical protein
MMVGEVTDECLFELVDLAAHPGAGKLRKDCRVTLRRSARPASHGLTPPKMSDATTLSLI